AKFILELLDRIPQELYEKKPVLIVVRTRILISLTLFERAAKELKDAIPRMEAAPPGPEVHRVLQGCYITLGFIGFITSINTADYGFAGLFEKAAAYVPLSAYVTRPPVSVANICSYICRVYSHEKGETERYLDALAVIAPAAASVMGGCMKGLDDLARAEFAFFKGDSAEAEKHARTALLHAAEGMQYEIENRALFYLLRIYLSRGDYDEMRRILEKMEAQLGQGYYINRFIHHDLNRGWFYLQTGNTAALAPWLKNDFEESDLNSMARGLEILVKAKYHFAEKHYPAALAALENWTDDVGTPVLGKVETKALEAVCHYQLRDRAGAFAALEQAYTLAEPNGFTMPFTELGRYMRTLAEAALREKVPGLPPVWLEKTRSAAAAYAKKLYAAAALFGEPGAEQKRAEKRIPGTPTPLSRREKEIFACLSRGLTRPETAAALSLSVNTVKSNIRSVYNKLGAVNRADAIRVAADAGILHENPGV
ncbi:MAG: LuxR C-terminal-related transcriptional regulator, partial [Treponema sp.]|nr:LuxR C-terminal-related transcriptional regulator [Treponema sp.]